MITINVRESKNCNEQYSMFVSFEYNQKIVDTIRNLPTRFWNKDTKEWEVPIKKLEYLLNNLSEFDFDISGKYVELEKPKAVTPVNFNFKTQPYEHQIEGFNFGLQNDRWLLGDEMGLGKALALDTKIYTPTGYKLMRDISVGDYVLGRDGKPTKVLATYNHTNVEMYRITFSDGVSIDCCKDHLWKIYDQHGSKIVDTKWFTEKDQFGKIRKDHLKTKTNYKYWIDRCEPVQFEPQNVPIDAYVLGAILGDGGLTSNSIFFTTVDKEMVNKINSRLPKEYYLCSSQSMPGIDFYVKRTKGKTNELIQALKHMNLWKTNSHTKFIPDIYKYNSIAIRTEVLQGLLDTDGYATKDNLLTYSSVSKQLCDDVRFLVESLGGIANYSTGVCKYNGKITGTSHNLTIRFDNPSLYCTLTRKKSLLKERKFKPHRSIISVDKIENADAKCITVDNSEHLYLAEHFIVTHNTKQVIDIAVAKKLQWGYKHCLIICGVNGLKWNWYNEVLTHSDEKPFILGQRRRKNGNLYIAGANEKMQDILSLDELPYFIITNIETMRNQDIVSELVKLCKSKEIGLVAFDECHKAKDPTTQQGKGMLKVQADTMIAMTGTPLMNTPLDLFFILKWLGYEKNSYYKFRNHYAEYGGFNNYQILRYKNLDELQERLNDIMLRRLKDEVLDLPEKTYIDEYVDMTAKQEVIYKEVSMEIKSNIDAIKMSNNPLAELIRMRQATGYTGILSTTIQESAKLDRMEELVEEAVENGKKVVVFSNWTQMTTPIAERLAKYNPAVITGEISADARQQMIDKFQNDSKCHVILGTSGAMGTGLNLFAGTVEIFLDEPWNMALKEQCVDRCHRIGQKKNLTIYTIMCKGTIDEKVHEIVLDKGALSDAIVDGTIKHNKDELLDFLLS